MQDLRPQHKRDGAFTAHNANFYSVFVIPLQKHYSKFQIELHSSMITSKANEIPCCMNLTFIFISLISLASGCLDLHVKADQVINKPEKIDTGTFNIKFHMPGENVDETQVVQMAAESDEAQTTGIGNNSNDMHGNINKSYTSDTGTQTEYIVLLDEDDDDDSAAKKISLTAPIAEFEEYRSQSYQKHQINKANEGARDGQFNIQIKHLIEFLGETKTILLEVSCKVIKILNESHKDFAYKPSNQLNKITDEEMLDDFSPASNAPRTSDKSEFKESNTKFDIDLSGHSNTQKSIDRQFVDDRCFRGGSVSCTFL